ncbi:hypothetical protein DZA29_12725 [Citrobacter gillenii]|uniref:phage baseplate protein n=1 Tax=Citrobacter freundii TaxID=546 RepID=UPI000E3D9AAE|nr:hypothetical protein DZA29_12725 [Citrobacter gillenii]
MAEAALETGYKIADGIVTNQPEISFEGIVTSVCRVWDSVAAAAAVANMQAIWDSGEFFSAYNQ